MASNSSYGLSKEGLRRKYATDPAYRKKRLGYAKKSGRKRDYRKVPDTELERRLIAWRAEMAKSQ
jgi:hypothetical protein